MAKDSAKLVQLYEFIGSDKFLDFLQIFEGETLKVPSLDVLAGAVRDYDILVTLYPYGNVYKSIPNLPSRNSTTQKLCNKYGLDFKDITLIFRTLIEKLNLSVRCGCDKRQSIPGRLICFDCLQKSGRHGKK